MDSILITVTACGLVFAGIVKGVTGLGYASCALPFLVLAVDLQAAMAVVTLPAIATNLSVARSAGAFRPTVRTYWPLFLSLIPGVVLGVLLLVAVEKKLAVRSCAMLIMAYAILALFRPELRLPGWLMGPLQWPTGFFNGLAAGLTGAQVMPLFPYVLSLNLPKEQTVQVVNLAVLVASSVLAASLTISGIMTPWLTVASFLALIPALVGVAIGNSLRAYLTSDKYKSLALFTLLGLGALMLVRS